MDRWKLALSITVTASLALGACGSDGERPDITLPGGGSVTLPQRPSTAPPDTEPAATSAPETTQPEPTEPETTEAPPTQPEPTDPAPTEPETTEPETTTTDGADDEAPSDADDGDGDGDDTATEEGTPGDEGDEGSPWWPWVLTALAAIGVTVMVMRRRAARRQAWRDGTTAAFDEAARLATHLTAVAPEGTAAVAAQDAPHLADLSARLTALATEAADDAHRRAIESVQNQAQVLHGVLDGITLSAAAVTPAAVEYLREQARTLHAVTARARAEVFPDTAGSGSTRLE
jgi:hypothetical protein